MPAVRFCMNFSNWSAPPAFNGSEKLVRRLAISLTLPLRYTS